MSTQLDVRVVTFHLPPLEAVLTVFYPGQLDVLEEAVPTSRVSSSFSLSMFVMFMVAHQCSDPVGIALPLSGWSVARVFLARHISLSALLLFLRYFVSGNFGVHANIGEEYAHLRRSEEDLGSEVAFRMDDEWSIEFGPSLVLMSLTFMSHSPLAIPLRSY